MLKYSERPASVGFLCLLMLCVSCLFGTIVRAHEVIPSIMDVGMSDTAPNGLSIELTFTAEAFLAGLDLSEISETDDSDRSDQYDEIRQLSGASLSELIEQKFDDLAALITVNADDQRLDLGLEKIVVEDQNDLRLVRQTTLYLSAPLPDGARALSAGLDKSLGAVLVRQRGEGSDPNYSDYLTSGGVSSDFVLGTITEQSDLDLVLKYIYSGIVHIVPAGLDHILFVIGLLAFSLSGKALVAQISLFTVAHTLTLAMASLGWVAVPGAIVEPLIALSIAYIGIENIWRAKGRLTLLRSAVVFGFGLLHGLGFASVLADFGLPSHAFVLGLLSFNIGVEIGQLMVVIPVFALLTVLRLNKYIFRQRFQVPVSLSISFVGLYWAAERLGILPVF
jgi:hypothetical protein